MWFNNAMILIAAITTIGMFAKIMYENEKEIRKSPKIITYTPPRLANVAPNGLPYVLITPAAGGIHYHFSQQIKSDVTVIGEGKLQAWRHPEHKIGPIILNEVDGTGEYFGQKVTWRVAD